MRSILESSLLGLLLAASGFEASLFAADLDDLTYVVSGSTVEITGCDTSASGALDIPAYIEGRLVTSIRSLAFLDCSGLTSVTIPDGVTSIGDSAFYGCSGLTTLAIPDSVTSLGHGAVANCSGLMEILVGPGNPSYLSDGGVLFSKDASRLISYPAGKAAASYVVPSTVTVVDFAAFANCRGLTFVSIPHGVTSIADNAFFGCTGLESIDIPGTVTWISYNAFAGCTSLRSVSIPGSVNGIGVEAFADCSNLTRVIFEGDAPNRFSTDWSSVFRGTAPDFTVYFYDGVSGFTTPTWQGYPSQRAIPFLPNATYELNGGAVTITDFSSAVAEALVIPDYIEGQPVAAIGDVAFRGCSATSLIIPESVASIGNEAFFACGNLTSVTIPESVTSIGDRAFHFCIGLTDILVDPDNLSFVSSDGVLFSGDERTLIRYPSSRVALGYDIPSTVTAISSGAFDHALELTAVTIPEGVTSIGDRAFNASRRLSSVSISDSVTSIGNEAFAECINLTSATFLGNAPSIGIGAFAATDFGFTTYFFEGATGFTTPNWLGYPCQMIASKPGYASWVQDEFATVPLAGPEVAMDVNSDGDRFTHEGEFLFGLSPHLGDGGDAVEMAAISGGLVTVEFLVHASATGHIYSVQTKSDIDAPSWAGSSTFTPQGAGLPPLRNGAPGTVNLETIDQGNGYYLIREQLPVDGPSCFARVVAESAL